MALALLVELILVHVHSFLSVGCLFTSKAIVGLDHLHERNHVEAVVINSQNARLAATPVGWFNLLLDFLLFFIVGFLNYKLLS